MTEVFASYIAFVIVGIIAIVIGRIASKQYPGSLWGSMLIQAGWMFVGAFVTALLVARPELGVIGGISVLAGMAVGLAIGVVIDHRVNPGFYYQAGYRTSDDEDDEW